MVEPCLLAREIEVALDTEAASFIVGAVVEVKNRGLVSVRVSPTGVCHPICLCHQYEPRDS